MIIILIILVTMFVASLIANYFLWRPKVDHRISTVIEKIKEENQKGIKKEGGL